MLDISVCDISGLKKSRFGPVAEPSVAIIVILSMEIAGIVILMSVTTGSVAAPLSCIDLINGPPLMAALMSAHVSAHWGNTER